MPGDPSAICGLWAVDDRVVYAAGTNWPDRPAGMLKTEDGGSSWAHINMRGKADILVDVYFLDREHGWVVGGRGGSQRDQVKPVVLYTGDGGATWENRLESQMGELPTGRMGVENSVPGP